MSQKHTARIKKKNAPTIRQVLEVTGLIQPIAANEQMKPDNTYFGDPDAKGFTHICTAKYLETLGDYMPRVSVGDAGENLTRLVECIWMQKTGLNGYKNEIGRLADVLTRETEKKKELLTLLNDACDEMLAKRNARGR